MLMLASLIVGVPTGIRTPVLSECLRNLRLRGKMYISDIRKRRRHCHPHCHLNLCPPTEEGYPRRRNSGVSFHEQRLKRPQILPVRSVNENVELHLR